MNSLSKSKEEAQSKKWVKEAEQKIKMSEAVEHDEFGKSVLDKHHA